MLHPRNYHQHHAFEEQCKYVIFLLGAMLLLLFSNVSLHQITVNLLLIDHSLFSEEFFFSGVCIPGGPPTIRFSVINIILTAFLLVTENFPFLKQIFLKK
jgi:hypothetical protein